MCLGLMKRAAEHVRNSAGERGLLAHLDAGLNGVMSREASDWVLRHLDGATVSLDGLPEIHDAQRPLVNGKASFDKVRATLQRLDDAGFNYGIRLTVTDESVHRLAESVAFIATHFAAPAGIQAEPLFAVGRAHDAGMPAVDPRLFVAQFRQAAQAARRHGVQLKYSGARFGTTTNAFCKAAGDSFAVTPDGHVTSCYEVADAADPRSALFFFGRLDQERGEFEFDPARLDTLRRLTVEHKPHCHDCFCKWHCAGDCPAKLATLGDAWDPSTSLRCHINRELTKDQMLECLEAGEAPAARAPLQHAHRPMLMGEPS